MPLPRTSFPSDADDFVQRVYRTWRKTIASGRHRQPVETIASATTSIVGAGQAALGDGGITSPTVGSGRAMPRDPLVYGIS